MIRSRTWLVGVVACLFLLGCAGTQQQSSSASLYDRLGGKDAISAVVDDLIVNVAADDRINKFFAHADPANLKRHLVDQVCAGTGGPCQYTGRDMQTTHKDMAITEAHFNALVEDLVKSLDKHKVPAQEKGELLSILGSMKGAIVNTK